MGKKIKLTIRNKILISYTVIMMLLLITGLIGIYYVEQVYNNGKDIYENYLKVVESLKSMDANLKEIDKCTLQLFVAMDGKWDEDCESQITRLMEDNISLMNAYSKLDISGEEAQVYQLGRESVLEYHEQIKKILSMAQLADETAVLNMYQMTLVPVKDSAIELMEEAVEIAVVNAGKANQKNYNICNKIIWIISSFMLIAFVIAIVISYSMSNHILSKLKSIQMMAKRMSEYNISDDIENVENDEFGKTVEALNESQFMVRELLEKIIGESAVISDMGEEVSLAVRKSEQRVEHVNVSILEYEKLAEEVEEQVKHIVEERTLSEEERKALADMSRKLEEAKWIREQARTELSSIATYLEQIGITSDYQNEIANRHKDQVKKFKVKERED